MYKKLYRGYNGFIKICLIIIFFINIAEGAEIVVKGNYYGKNLYVVNSSCGGGFCVEEVFVNDIKTSDEINSNSFEIDFSQLGIKVGETVDIKIKHKDNCKPTVFNPEVLKQQNNFTFTSIKFDKDKNLTWSVSGTVVSEPFIVEEFRWGKWIETGRIDFKDTIGPGRYILKGVSQCFGMNDFRVKHIDAGVNYVYSKELKFRSKELEVLIKSPKITTVIEFTAATRYEIFTNAGNFVKDGTGDKADVSDLEKGEYWINYDNKTEKFSKK